MNERIRKNKAGDGATIWSLERPDGKPNLIDERFLDELEKALTHLEQNEKTTGLLIRSSHPKVFLAGADLSQLAEKSSRELEELLKRGQEAFSRLARLRIPTACAINGACLGGGYEMALACDFRVASETKHTVIGLPETSLGLLPGWGGCYRLPRLIGFARALTVIATGKPFRPAKAKKLEMVDEVVADELTEVAAKERLERGKKSAPRFFLTNLRPASWLVGWAAKRKVMAKTRGNYPAPPAAIKTITKATYLSEADAMNAERRAFSGLAKTATARNLVRYFFMRERAKKVNFRFKSKRLPETKRAHVVGAGVMGGGIAHWIASRGIKVVLSDLSVEALSKGLGTVEALLRKGRSRGITSRLEARDVMDRITPMSEPVGLREGDLVIEAIVERIGAKRSLFGELEKRSDGKVPFASNTSGLSIDSMSVAMRNRGRLGGLHFFNPVHRMELVEVIRGARTDPEVVQTLLAFVRRIGKRGILCKDSPGFLVNRILVPYLVEAAQLWMAGGRAEEIDAAMTNFGMPMGPMRLLDEIGLDVANHVAKELKFRLSHLGSPPDFLEKMVGEGLLGKKAGKGFYKYRMGKSNEKPNGDLKDLLDEESKGSRNGKPGTDEATERMTLVMINEATRCIEEGVVDNPEDVDFGMISGAGWAPFRGGPLRHADSLGLCQVVTRMERLRRKEGNRFRPASLLLDLARNGQKFYPDSGGKPGHITFKKERNSS